MGFDIGNFFKENAGMIGSAAGSAIGGPVGGVVGGSLGSSIQRKEEARKEQALWDRNVAMQREFAQNGIRWKMEDAKAAGIHPLAALGVQPMQFNAPIGGGSSSGPDLGTMGQDLTRAISATRTGDERRINELTIQGAQLDLQGKELDNALKMSQLRKAEGVGPAMPDARGNFISGQGDTGRAQIVEKPLERTASLPGHPEAEAGAIPDVGWAVTATGLVPVPSNDVKQRIEDNMPQEWMHFARNNILPSTKPPKSSLPKGATDWKWAKHKMEWQAQYPRRKKNHPAVERWGVPLNID